MSKLRQGCSLNFIGLKLCQILFFWVGKFLSYFWGFHKIFAIFFGLANFQLFFFEFSIPESVNEEHTVLESIKLY